MSSPPERRNSPVVLVAVLITVMVGVLLIAVVGRVVSRGLTTVVPGTALAVGEDGPGSRNRSGAISPADVAANPLLSPGATLPTVDCALPAFGTGPDQLRAYYLAGIRCLDEAWRPTLRATGLPFTAPYLDVSDRPSAKCGFAPAEDEATAFYCSRDTTIYMPRVRLLRDAGPEPAYHLAILAHEYGHHVQSLSGILDDSTRLESGVDEAGVLRLSRRTELQANCFAGLFLAAATGRAAITTALGDEALRSFADTSGTDTHGAPDTQARWATRGFEGRNTNACDTWTAPNAEVN